MSEPVVSERVAPPASYRIASVTMPGGEEVGHDAIAMISHRMPALAIETRAVPQDDAAFKALHAFDVVCVNEGEPGSYVRGEAFSHHTFSRRLRDSGFKGRILHIRERRHDDREESVKRRALFDGTVDHEISVSPLGDFLGSLSHQMFDLAQDVRREAAQPPPERIGVLSDDPDMAMLEAGILRGSFPGRCVTVTASCPAPPRSTATELDMDMLKQQDVVVVSPIWREDRGHVFIHSCELILKELHKRGYKGQVIYREIDDSAPAAKSDPVAFATTKQREKQWIEQMKAKGFLHDTMPRSNNTSTYLQALATVNKALDTQQQKKAQDELLPDYLKRWDMAAKVEEAGLREADWPKRLQVDYAMLGEGFVSKLRLLPEEVHDYGRFEARLDRLWDAEVKAALEAKGRLEKGRPRRMTDTERLEGISQHKPVPGAYDAWEKAYEAALYKKIDRWRLSPKEQQFPYAQREQAGNLLDYGKALAEALKEARTGDFKDRPAYEAAVQKGFATRLAGMMAAVHRLEGGEAAVVAAITGQGALPLRMAVTHDEHAIALKETEEQKDNRNRLAYPEMPKSWTKRASEMGLVDAKKADTLRWK